MGTIVRAQTPGSPEAEKTQDSGRKTPDGKQTPDGSQPNPPSQEGSKKE